MSTKALLFLLDGGDPGFINTMIEDGELPNLKMLRERASAFPIRNDPAMGAAQFWNCISVGGGPDNHGHYFYMQFKPDSYDVVPNHESSLPVITPFWETLDHEGYKVAVIDLHRMKMSPLKHGLLLDNWLGHDPLTGTKSWPPQVRDTLGDYYSDDSNAGGFAARKRKTADEFNAYLQNLLNRIEAKTKFCIDQINDNCWDLFVASFSEIHDLGHFYYHIEHKNHEHHDPALAAEVPHPMRQGYRKLDWALGELMQAVGDNTAVSAIAGPGMERLISANSAFDDIVRCIDCGIDTPKTSGESIRHAYSSFIPLALRRHISPLARMFRRKLLNQEYLKRRFFAVPHNDNSGAIRINVKGREKQGIISPGDEYDAVVAEIKDAMSTFTNPDNGRALVKRFVCTHHDYNGPYTDVLPDIFVEWDRRETAYDFRVVISERYGEFEILPSHRTGDHNACGFFWSADGPDIASGVYAPRRPGDITDYILRSVRRHRPTNLSH